MKTQELEEGQTVVLAPNEVIIVSAEEHLFLPSDIVGHLSLKMHLLLRGLTMASQSQVDAGYEGWIFALLYNLSDAPVELTQGRSFLRLELVKLANPSQKPYEYGFTDKKLQQQLKGHVGTSLQTMRQQVDTVEGRLNRRTAFEFVGALGALIALFAVLYSFSNEINNVTRSQIHLTDQLKPVPSSVAKDANTVRALCQEVKRLEHDTKTRPSSRVPKC